LSADTTPLHPNIPTSAHFYIKLLLQSNTLRTNAFTQEYLTGANILLLAMILAIIWGKLSQIFWFAAQKHPPHYRRML